MTDAAQSGERRRLVLVSGAIVGLTLVFFIDLCGAVFGCGCRSLWSGAATMCNVHAATPPHCPWCAHPGWGGAVAFFAIVAAQLATIYVPTRLAIGTRVLLAAAAMPVVGGAVGWLQGWLFGYWA